DGVFKLFNGAHRHFNLWAPGGKLQKGAGPCELEEAKRRTHDCGHPWYGQRLWRAETYKAPNVLIQSAAAIQTKMWMRECWHAGIVPLLQMHDCLGLSVTSPKTAEMVARLGEETLKLEVPMKVDVNYGRTWGDAKHTWAELFNGGASPAAKQTMGEMSDEIEIPPAYICARCKLDPPNGTERQSAYNDLWLHPSCEDELLQERLAEEGLQTIPAAGSATTNGPPTGPATHPQQVKPPPSGNSGGNGYGARQQKGGSKAEAERDNYAKKHAGEPFNDV